MGGIDIKEAMTGLIEGVEEEVKKRINIFGKGVIYPHSGQSFAN